MDPRLEKLANDGRELLYAYKELRLHCVIAPTQELKDKAEDIIQKCRRTLCLNMIAAGMIISQILSEEEN